MPDGDAIAMCLVWETDLIIPYIVDVICALILVVLVPFSMYKAISAKLNKSFKRLYYINCILFVIGCIGYAVLHYIPFRRVCATFNELRAAAWCGYEGYNTGLTTLYYLLLFRIHLMLKGSRFELNKYIYYGTAILILMNWILLLIGALYYSSAGDGHNENGKICHTISGILSIFIIITIAVIFISKTTKLYQNLVKDEVSKRNNDKLTKILSRGAIKYCICSSISLISSLIAVFWSLYRTAIVEVDTMPLYVWHAAINNVDALVNFICLALQFSFTEPVYKALCGCCDCWERRLDEKNRKNKNDKMPNTVPIPSVNSTKSDVESTNNTTINDLTRERVNSTSSGQTHTVDVELR